LNCFGRDLFFVPV